MLAENKQGLSWVAGFWPAKCCRMRWARLEKAFYQEGRFLLKQPDTANRRWKGISWKPFFCCPK